MSKARLEAFSDGVVAILICLVATIVVTVGQFMATALGAPGPGRFRLADTVVRAHATVKLGYGNQQEELDVQRPPLLPVAALACVKGLPGVQSAHPPVALRDRKQGPRRQIHSDPYTAGGTGLVKSPG